MSSVLAAQEINALVKQSSHLWRNAITSLNDMPINYFESTKSICAFMRGENLEMNIVADCSTDNSKGILERLQGGVKKPLKPRPRHLGPLCICMDCGKRFTNPYLLNVHLKNSAVKEACPKCGVVCRRGEELKMHLQNVHDETWLKCKDCTLLFPNQTALKDHKARTHKTAGVRVCAECGRHFTRRATYEAHSQMHAVRMCRACGKQFDNRACYRTHRSQCEPNAKPRGQNLTRSQKINVRDPSTFICDYCMKTYSSRPQLKNHILWIHMDVRPHQCQWCGKRFYTSARLAEHTIVHTRERNFGCDICGARLVSKMAAVYHRRRHTGEKPYACEDCGDTFISSSRRSEHAKRRHGKGSRMQCRQCPLSFVRSHELRKHVEKAHSFITMKEV